MKYISLFILAVTIAHFGFSQTGPGGVGTNDGTSNLETWFRSDFGTSTTTNGDGNSIWSDGSGNGINATVNGSRTTPSYNSSSINNQPGITFDGISNQYEFDRMVQDDYSLIVVFNTNTNQIETCVDNQWFCGYGLIDGETSGINPDFGMSIRFNSILTGGGSPDVSVASAGTINDGLAHLSINIRDQSSGTINLYVDENNTNITGSTESQVNSSRLTLGSIQTNIGFYTGDINEVIVFSKTLNSAERIILSNYLSAKYGFSLNSNDIYNQDNVLEGNFDHDVAGIGRVDATNIHNDAQGTGIVRILNPNGLGDDEFLIWGHDNGTQQAIDTTDVPAVVQARFDRVWRASEANSSGTAVDVGSIDIRFDLTGLGAVTASDLRLLIDSDNDGVFNDEIPIGGATAIGGNVYEFAGVTAIANNLRFTLGTINTNQTSLPIELLSFSAVPIENRYVELNWQTVSETNNDYFTIERSNNSFDWEKVSEVDGAGNSSSILNYSTIDKKPYNDVSYYRLKQTDFNGKFEYSKIRSVTINPLGNSQIEIYPNPTESHITIVGDVFELEQVKIYDVLGQDVTTFTDRISGRNEDKLVIDLSNLTTGMYYIKTKTTANKLYKQ